MKLMNINKMVAGALLTSALTLGLNSAAMAQSAVPAGPESEAAPAPEAAPAEPAAPAQNPQIVAFVDSQFPAADANSDGTLTAVEFTTWISGLKTAEQQKAGQPADAAAAKAYADNALANADKDKDGVLTKAELVTFFGG
jgi:hypothetical protein